MISTYMVCTIIIALLQNTIVLQLQVTYLPTDPLMILLSVETYTLNNK